MSELCSFSESLGVPMPFNLLQNRTRLGRGLWKIVLAEKGLPWNGIWVKLAKREQKSPEHLKRNPYGKIPVIEEAAELAALRRGNGKTYLQVKGRALERLPEFAAEPVIANCPV